VLIGIAQAGTTYAVVYGVIGRNVSAERRSWAMGMAAAAGSFGQFLMVPVEGWLISQFGWQQALLHVGRVRLADGAPGLGPARADVCRWRRGAPRADHRRRCARPSSTAASSC
jgi:nitrate/nitrite transporter NarK